MTHLIYLALIGCFLMYSQNSHWLVFWTMATVSLLVGAVPLKIGVNALEKMEF